MKNALYILIAAVFFAACSSTPEINVSVRECAPMPEGRASACACAMGGNAYVFSGRTAGKKYLKDLWLYNSQSDIWTRLGEGPMAARVNATIAAYDGKLYAGLGYSETHAYRDINATGGNIRRRRTNGGAWQISRPPIRWRLSLSLKMDVYMSCMVSAMDSHGIYGVMK